MLKTNSEDNGASIVVPAPAPASAETQTSTEVETHNSAPTVIPTTGSETTLASSVIEISAPAIPAIPAAPAAPAASGAPPTPTAPAIAPQPLAVTRAVADLRPHEENAKIYGDKESIDDLCKSISRNNTGILESLLITKDNRIISGHRRYRAAVKLELAEVPVRTFESDDEIEILNALLEHNRHRIKSKAQIAAEALLRLRIEKERAAKRKAGANGQVEILPPREKGKARDAAGKALGISGKSAEMAAQVAEAHDKLVAGGQHEEAAELKTATNKGYTTGHKLAVEKGHITVKKRPKAKAVKPVEAPPAQAPVFELMPASDPLPPAKKVSGPSEPQPTRPPASDESDCDDALEMADDALSFLRSPAAKLMTQAQKKNWTTIFDQLQTCRANVGI